MVYCILLCMDVSVSIILILIREADVTRGILLLNTVRSLHPTVVWWFYLFAPGLDDDSVIENCMYSVRT
jgi:hypothetical protein